MLEADSNQLNCIADLIFIALLECFASGETSITLAQLHTRNFTPHQQATRDCICYLFKQGRVTITPFTQKSRGRIQIRDTSIRVNIAPADVPKLIINLSYGIKGKIADDNCRQFLATLDEQLKVYECVEYCRYYLDREGLVLRGEFTLPYKLPLMVMELAQEQIFMLLWRAVKTASILALQKKRKSVSISELCDLAYKYFLNYRKRDIEIDFYRMPYSVGNSSLRNLLTKHS